MILRRHILIAYYSAIVSAWSLGICVHVCSAASPLHASVASQTKASATPDPACTAPFTPYSAERPYCYLPLTISSEARSYLASKAVNKAPPLDKPGAAAQLQQAFNTLTAPASAAAAKQYLQGIRNETIAGMPVSIATPKGFKQANAGKLLIYLHGGGYIKGSCYYLWHVTAMLAKQAGIQVLCVEYRLAPQHPFPAGLNDAAAVYKALVQQQQYKPQNLALVGDSAGGGLALALLHLVKQQQLPLPSVLLLLSPWSELAKTGDTQTTLTAVDPCLQYELNLQGAALAYVGGDKSKLSDPLVSPLRDSFSVPFPATLIQVGLRDSLLSYAALLYRKLRDGGVSVVFSPWEGMWHVFQASLAVPEAQAANKEMAQFLVQHLGGQ